MNLLGLSTGPVVIGILTDQLSLSTAMRPAPAVSIVLLTVHAGGRRASQESARSARRAGRASRGV